MQTVDLHVALAYVMEILMKSIVWTAGRPEPARYRRDGHRRRIGATAALTRIAVVAHEGDIELFCELPAFHKVCLALVAAALVTYDQSFG